MSGRWKLFLKDLNICSYIVSAVLAKQTGKGVDLDAPGTINGVSVYEYDLTSLDVDEKPWRKPGLLHSDQNAHILYTYM